MKLINEFPENNEIHFNDELRKAARLLDKYYIPTRYPDSFPDFTPGEVYQKKDAEIGLEKTTLLLEFAKSIIKENLY
jgi:HEPN domain-containing protein